ncbi:hypothetical protein CK203_004763 [Vitis vinifera]|uniref:Uncharacterized protein n=1 Tax=Vitis vinifera TaxID=29760 RepID=A0A438KFZ2_VITVI|nr:hypothetical protein CK203_004763 [Vitis vinifera]
MQSINGTPYVAGSQCLDILPTRSTDPEWLAMQRLRLRSLKVGLLILC